MKTFKHFNEAVIKSRIIDHTINRLKKVVRLLEPIKDNLILYRHFNAPARPSRDLIMKVTSDTRRDYIARTGGSTDLQIDILKRLGITKPIFTMQSASSSSLFGKPNIIIPPESYQVFWSPDIEDLGSTHLPSTAHLSVENYNKEVDALVQTYEKVLPKVKTTNEIILNADYYYLLDLKAFVDKVMGKNKKGEYYSKNMLYPTLDFKDFNATLFSQKFTKYKDITWWIENRMLGYLEFLKGHQ